MYFRIIYLSKTLDAISFQKKKTPPNLSSAKKFAILRNYRYCGYVIIDIFTFYYILYNSNQSYQFSNVKIRNSNFY